MITIQRTSEFDRIAAIPWYDWRQGIAEVRAHLEGLLRLPGGRESLFDEQAAALWVTLHTRGLLGGMGTGVGKSLTSYLIGALFPDCSRIMLIVPAKLVEQTARKIRAHAQHWKIPEYIRIVSYHDLSGKGGSQILDSFAPQIVIADECHKLKNRKAGCTIKLRAYLDANPSTIFAGLSGTLSRKQIAEMSHLARYATRHTQYYPFPRDWHEFQLWASVVDLGLRDEKRAAPGALLSFALPEDYRDADGNPRSVHEVARIGVGRRLYHTPGVILCEGKDGVDASLLVEDEILPRDYESEAVHKSIEAVRETWKDEEGYYFAESAQVWSAVRQRANGFRYRYKRRPPESWFVARKRWAQVARKMIGTMYGGTLLATEGQVVELFAGQEVLEDWKAEQVRFGRPELEPVWIDQAVLAYCARWLSKEPRGICWIEHGAFGDELSRLTGLPYFREQGRDASGRYILDARGPILASIAACSEGFDLQYHHDSNLYPSPFASGALFEQTIARTHRRHQPSDEVRAKFLIHTREHADATRKILEESSRADHTSAGNLTYKISGCDLNLKYHDQHPEILQRAEWSARWQRTAEKPEDKIKNDERLAKLVGGFST